MMVVGVATFLYLNSCEVGGNFIFNLSGKYFIPIFPLFLLILPNVCLAKWESRNRLLRAIFRVEYQAGFIVFSLIYGLFEVIWRYYA
jgi:uncharacterized membrane protein